MFSENTILVIDVGNTHSVIGVYQGEKLISHWRLSSKLPRTEDELWIHLKMWMEEAGVQISLIKSVIISSVVPAMQTVLCNMTTERLGLSALVISDTLNTGLDICYTPASAVGADRICNAVAGFHGYGGPLIIVDFGTATTFDVVSKDGAYLGGVIALGLMGASEELHRISAKLPRVALDFPAAVVGQTTETSMQSGILWG
ncbi:type III pantothenate kinase, partial [bacterium]|nr:type III pantothenate kinase [bacterium]